MPKVAVQKFESIDHRVTSPFEEIQEEACRLALELFQLRGCEAGRPLEDWLAAERKFLGSPALDIEETAKAYELQVVLSSFAAAARATPFKIIVQALTKSAAQSSSPAA